MKRIKDNHALLQWPCVYTFKEWHFCPEGGSEGGVCFAVSTSHSTVCLVLVISIAVCSSFEDLEKAGKLTAQLVFVPEEV